MFNYFKRIILVGLIILTINSCSLAAKYKEYLVLPLPLSIEQLELTRVGNLEFRGAVEIQRTDLGGLSGLWVAKDRQQFVTISDRGQLFSGKFKYDAMGNLLGAEQLQMQPIIDSDGLPVTAPRHDAEDITRTCDGSWLISFEQQHRVMQFNDLKNRPTNLPLPLAITKHAAANSGIEGMTVLSDCRLVIFEEGDNDKNLTRHGWITNWPPTHNTDWQHFSIKTPSYFRVTGAAALPSGLVVLQRQITLLGGWKTRIVQIANAELTSDAAITGKELALLEAPMINDNFEGIATQVGSDGEILIYIVSDNNFNPFQKTIFMLFALK